MNPAAELAFYLAAHKDETGRVVDFDPLKDRLYQLNLTSANTHLNQAIITDAGKFTNWINDRLVANNCRFGVGGYMERRVIYAQPLFNKSEAEPRNIHLGVDIWAEAGTPVYAPLNGTVHSINNNNNKGDYGPTIILAHDLDGLRLYSLYGHLSTGSIKAIKSGDVINKGQLIGWFGKQAENGNWPPHLHFQLMFDMEGMQGDYPGVCSQSEKAYYQNNVPDPQLILQFPKAVNV